MFKNFRNLFCTVCLLFIATVSYASHLVGMDLQYTHVSGNTYKVILTAYGDCSGGSYYTFSSSSPTIYVWNGNTYVDQFSLDLQAPTDGIEITPVCPADIGNTTCTNPSAPIPGITKFVYSGTYTVSGPSAYWQFLFSGDLVASSAGRSAAITNIVAGTTVQLIDTLNNMTGFNNSPNLTVIPTPFFCNLNNDSYNPGAVDPDGDNLTFFLFPGYDGSITTTPGSPVTYIAPYTATNPLQVTTMTFDPLTGQINFYPNALQRSLVVYNIEERRGGVLVGTCQREMTFLVQTCTTTPPSGGLTGASSGTIIDSTHFQICANTGPYTININPTEPGGINNITVTYSGLPTGSTFTIASNGTPTPHCTFSWNSTGVAPGTYTFFVTYTDNNCPLQGVQTVAYTVTILPAPTVTTSILYLATCANPKSAVLITPSSGGPWVIKVSDAPGDTIQTFTGCSTAFIDSLPPGTYTITVIPPVGCPAVAFVDLSSSSIITPHATFTNPTMCGKCDGSITFHGLWPGYTATIHYNLGGIAQTFVGPVASDSTVIFTNLCVGNTPTTYSGILVTVNGCTVPCPNIVLTSPTISSTHQNPSLCGIRDGYIKLYNLPADSVFTVTYTGAVGSPTVVTVGITDTLTLPYLSTGTYTSISATINGIHCNVPDITLSAPGISAIFGNPTICGKRDGFIKLYNLPADSIFTVTYTGAAGSPAIATVASNDTLTLPYLGDGTYGSISATINGTHCIVPDLTLSAPGINAVYTNPTICGKNDGSITLYDLPADSTFQVTFSGPGTGSGESLTVGATDSLTIPNLLAGLYPSPYTAITATINGTHCHLTVPVTLTDPPVHAQFDTTIHLGCNGELVDFTSLSTPAGYNYSWYFGDGTNQATNSPNTAHTYMDAPSYVATYTVTLVYQTYGPGCKDTATATINFNHPLNAAFTPSADTVCLYPLTAINFSNTSFGSALTYAWDFGDGATSTAFEPSHTYIKGGVYNTVLTITDNIGCGASATANIDVIKMGVRVVTHDTTVCLTSPLALIAKTDAVPGTYTSISYAWLPNNNLSTYTDATTYFMGIGDFSYTVTATTIPMGCQASDVEVIHSMPPITLVNLTQSQTIPYGSSIQLNADGADYYTWVPNDGTLTNNNINNPKAAPLDSTTYTVYGMSVFGCKDSAKITIGIDDGMSVFIPTAFSPNGDGLNDRFRVVNLKYQKLVDMKVFNRWGEQLFQTTNPQDGWDGTYKGVAQDLDTYNYEIILSTPGVGNKVYTGTVTLVR